MAAALSSPENPGITYTRAVPAADELVALYAVVYAEPPYGEGPDQFEQFRAALPDELEREGFSLVAGAELIRQLLADRPERYATLLSDPRSAARRIYERAGWQQVARMTLAWGPAMDLLVLDLTGP